MTTEPPWPWPKTMDALVAAPTSHRVLLENDCVYPAGHGYRTLPEYRHRLSRSGRSRDVLRGDAGLEGRHLPGLGRGPRGVRPVHHLPAGAGLHTAEMAGTAGAPADASRRDRRRSGHRRGG